jgi:hypothetical protein
MKQSLQFIITNLAKSYKNQTMSSMKLVIIFLFIGSFTAPASALTYDEIVVNKVSNARPYWGEYYEYKNIEWISHQPYFEGLDDEEYRELEMEAIDAVDERGQIDIGRVDFNRDKEYQYIKVMWTAYGGPARGLIIDVYQDENLKSRIAIISPQKEGVNPNFKIEDIDGDGVLELITFSGQLDPNMSNVWDGDTPFQGRFSDMFLLVSIYKFIDGSFSLDYQYVTEHKYQPYYIPQDNMLPN